MELSQLELLSTLVEDANLSRAALRLHMTQSAISKRVKSIEEEIGFPLFERRGPQGLKPLPQAYDLAKLGDRVNGAWDLGLKRIRSQATEPQHLLLVGPELFLRDVILPWWTKTSNKFPKLQLEISISPISLVSVDTLKLGADVGILEHKEELSDFVCKPIYIERWGIVRNPQVRLPELSDYQWGTPSLTHNPVDTWLVKRRKMPQPNYRIVWGDMTAIALWIAQTPGAASVLPWHSVAQLSQQKLVTFERLNVVAQTHLYLAYRKETLHRQFIQELFQLSNKTD